jgi:hypothetical protein
VGLAVSGGGCALVVQAYTGGQFVGVLLEALCLPAAMFFCSTFIFHVSKVRAGGRS